MTVRPLFLGEPRAFAALERRYNGPIPPAELLTAAALDRHAQAQSALFDRLARDSAAAIARRRAVLARPERDSRLAALARNLGFYRRQGIVFAQASA